MEKPKYLIYTLVNFRTRNYLAMFRYFLKSIETFSNTKLFDILVICPSDVKQHIPENVKTMIVPETNDLYATLLGKFDINKYKDVYKYEKVLYIDCDIIVQGDLAKVFQNTPIKPGKLYAPAEGELDGRYWYLDAYKNSNIAKLKQNKIKSFNSGLYMFVPTKDMMAHFKNAKRFGLNYNGQHFYDQSIFNYYFNMNKLSSTKFFTDDVVMFPDITKDYTGKIFIHFSGIGLYQKKAKDMMAYFKRIKQEV